MDNTKVSAVRGGFRGTFQLNKMHTTTADFFRWDVAHCIHCIPKDVVQVSLRSYVESAANPYPINGSMSYGMYAFFVPNRIVWEDWKYYITDLQSGLTPPYFTLGDLVDAFHSPDNPWAEEYFNEGVRFVSNIDNLSSLMSFVINYTSSEQVDVNWRTLKLNAMPLRMVQRIWFDWMRDKVHISDNAIGSYCKTTGGHISLSELISLITPKYRCYPKNYITSSFDSPQEGSPAIQPVRIADSVRNPGIPGTSAYDTYTALGVLRNGNVSQLRLNVEDGVTRGSASTATGESSNIIGQYSYNDIRMNTSKQQYAERLLVAGKTVLSRCLALMDVSPTIEELQMSDYLGGHEADLKFQQQFAGQTSSISTDHPETGGAGAFGYDPSKATFAGQKFQNIISPDENGFGLDSVVYKTDETGYLFVMSAITPHVQYYQGLNRNWTRGLDTFASDKFDYFHKDFENQPLQPVLNYEVCCSPLFDPRGVFGFNQMYLDLKMSMDSLGGDFINPESNVGLNNMHLGRDIETIVSVAAGEDPDVESYLTPQVLTNSSGIDQALYDQKFTISQYYLDHFIVNHKITVNANRPMQQISLPSLDANLSGMTAKNLIETGGLRL